MSETETVRGDSEIITTTATRNALRKQNEASDPVAIIVIMI